MKRIEVAPGIIKTWKAKGFNKTKPTLILEMNETQRLPRYFKEQEQ